MDTTDTWTKVLDRALDIIFVKYPARTGLGVICGCVLSFIVQLFAPTLRSLSAADFAGSPWWGWIPVGILVMHIPTIASLFRQRPIGNDSIDQALDLIERANFSQAERRQQFRNLIERVTNNVALTKEAQRELKNTQKHISADE